MCVCINWNNARTTRENCDGMQTLTWLPLLEALLIQKDKTKKFLSDVADKEFMVAIAEAPPRFEIPPQHSACSQQRPRQQSPPHRPSKGGNIRLRHRFWLSRLPHVRKDEGPRPRPQPTLSTLLRVARSQTATGDVQPPTVMSIYRARAAAVALVPPEY